MLKELGLKNIEDLFSDIPQKIKIKNFNLPDGLSQQETEKKLRKIVVKNKPYTDFLSFLGGGIKPHFIPAIVKSITSRSEFYTAYTPYQSEASQGFLQAMFEYQSMIAEITGMDVANCSLYDGVTSLSEAALMCTRITRKKTFIMPHNISWDKKCVLGNYAKGPGIKIKEVSYDDLTGKIDIDDLKKKIDGDTAGVFEINNATNELLADSEKLDYEKQKSYELMIRASYKNDTIDLADTAMMVVKLLNINDNAPLFNDTTFSIPENSPAQTVVGELNAVDPDGDIIYYEIIEGNKDNIFYLAKTIGTIKVTKPDSLDYENENRRQFILTVVVKELYGPHSDTATMIIEVTNDPSDDDTSIPVAIVSGNNIKVYPNPANDRLYIELPYGRSGIFDVEIINLTGRTVYRHRVHQGQIDVSGFAEGLYLVKVTTNHKVSINKILIKQ